MVLEDIEAGSLKVYLRNILNKIDDEAIKSLEWKKAVGTALLKAKYLVLRWLDSEDGSGKAIDILREELRTLAHQTDIKHLPDYAPIQEARLLASMDKIQEAKRTLNPHDRLIVETDFDKYEVDLSKTWEPSEVIPLEHVQETYSKGEIILTIRKPDLLKDTMWQFSHGKSTIYAPIKDEKWLDAFHRREVPIYSGDALRCEVEFAFVYDEQGTLIDQKITVTKVLEVIRGPGPQTELFEKT